MPLGKNHHIRTLERRIAGLENFIARHGLTFSEDEVMGSASPSPHNLNQAPSGPELDVQQQQQQHDLPDGCGQQSHVQGDQSSVGPLLASLVDLSIDVKGGYLGASSLISMARVLSVLVEDYATCHVPSDKAVTATAAAATVSSPSPSTSSAWDDERSTVALENLPEATAERLLGGYLKYISTRWPVLHSRWVKKLHSRRQGITDVFEYHILHLVYATGGRFLETAGDRGHFRPDLHHQIAMETLPQVLRLKDSRPVCSLLLLALWGMRSSCGGAGAWVYSRMAILQAIDLGLHRQIPTGSSKNSLENEMRKRIFWACYSFDRLISIPLGRPFALSDRDIDIGLPLDIDEDCIDDRYFDEASQRVHSGVSEKTKSLSLFIHIARLRMIESEIQQTVYRVDQPDHLSESVVRGFIDRLTAWRDMIPYDAKDKVDESDRPFDGYIYYMVYYHKALRFLLYATLSDSQLCPIFLKDCAAACSSLCQSYKTMHQSLGVGYAIMTVQTVFLAGLNLIYCTWLDPQSIFSIATLNDINVCSTMLFVIAERMDQGKRYRDVFERVRESIIDPIAAGVQTQPQQVVRELSHHLDQSSHINLVRTDGNDQFSRIVSRMAGGPVPNDEASAPVSTSSAGVEFGGGDGMGMRGDQMNLFELWSFDVSMGNSGLESMDLEGSKTFLDPFMPPESYLETSTADTASSP